MSALRRGRKIRWPALLQGMLALGVGWVLIAKYLERPAIFRKGASLEFALFLGVGIVLFLGGIWAVGGELLSVYLRARFGKWSRYRVAMPREAMGYAVILLTLITGALIGRSNMLMLVFGLMAGPFVLNGWFTFSMLRRTRGRRQLPARAMVGESCPVVVRVDNRNRWFSSWMLVVKDRIRHTREEMQGLVLFTRVPPRSEQAGQYRLTPVHRGRLEFGPLEVTSRFPLGLMERAVVADEIEELIVVPRVGRLTERWRRQGVLPSDASPRPRDRQGSFDDEFHNLREYRRGDNPRAIHWRTSARRNVLMVREFHEHRRQNLFVLLDLWQPPRPSPADNERIERAVSFAASICVDHCRQADDSRLIVAACGAANDRWEGPAGPATMTHLLDRLALVEAGPARLPADLPGQVDMQCPAPARKVLITTRPAGKFWLGGDAFAHRGDFAAGGDFLVVEAGDDMAGYIQYDDC